MRIPLDYYRILSVPIKATDQQLEQAYSDRLLQQPRREYNELAIQARQELIQQAYQVLSDPEQRANYDAQFLVSLEPLTIFETPKSDALDAAKGDLPIADQNSTTEIPLANPTIEISPAHMMGALLILHELGEYELVLTLGIDYYNSQEFSQLQKKQDRQISLAIQENIILSLALAYLELGRERWHRKEFETAALSDRLGVDLLEQEDLFPQVKQEIELDLYKLRPYRILELISQNLPNSAPRAKGFELLQEMLLQRQGIEGKGDDYSGLSFDQFLCFTQQLRTYLTSVEQQYLFDSETQTDSAIASYLAVYALLGRGFSGKQPELVLRAQRKLDYLSEKQDVTWEQAVCALLLGQTEKAINKVYQSKDTSKLNQILQHSPDSDDLLAGMCFYGEQWLHEDVLAQFVDLVESKLTLKEYFADREVQAYLNELVPATRSSMKTTASKTPSTARSTASQNSSTATGVGILSRWRNLFSPAKTPSVKVASSNQISQTAPQLISAGIIADAANATALESNPKSATSTTRAKSRSKPKSRSSKSRHRRAAPSQPKLHSKKPVQPKPKPLSLPLESRHRAVPPSVVRKAQGQLKQKKAAGKKKLNSATLVKGWLFIFGLIFGVGTLGFMTTKIFLNPTQKTATKGQLAIAISQPTVELPPVEVKPVVAKPKLTFSQKSQQVIEKWLSSKSAAFGKQYQIQELETILAEPLLTTWRNRAIAYQKGNFHREYQHEIEMRSAKINPNNPNLATVEARVKEVAQHYQSGTLVKAQSYDDNLLVRYQLVRQGEKWLIQNAEVLETL